MRTKEERSIKIKWLLKVAVITISVYLGLRYLLPLILPFAVSYFLAWIIRPVTEALYRKFKIPRILGGTGALLLLVGVFGTAFVLLINILVKEAIAFLRNLPVYLSMIADRLDSICEHCDRLMRYEIGTLRGIVDENLTNGLNRIKTNLMPEMTEHTISITVKLIAFMGIALIVFVAAVLIAKDLPEFHKRYENNDFYKDIRKVTDKLSEAGIAYLRSQLIIMSIVAGICVLALTLIKNDYAALIGIGIAIMDALPILGSGIVLVPWAIILLVDGKILAAAILMTAYLLCQIIREVLEPKLIGSRIGIKPLFTLFAMYIGVKLFGIIGFLLGPVGLLIIMTIYNAMNEKQDNVANKEDVSYNNK